MASSKSTELELLETRALAQRACGSMRASVLLARERRVRRVRRALGRRGERFSRLQQRSEQLAADADAFAPFALLRSAPSAHCLD